MAFALFILPITVILISVTLALSARRRFPKTASEMAAEAAQAAAVVAQEIPEDVVPEEARGASTDESVNAAIERLTAAFGVVQNSPPRASSVAEGLRPSGDRGSENFTVRIDDIVHEIEARVADGPYIQNRGREGAQKRSTAVMPSRPRMKRA